MLNYDHLDAINNLMQSQLTEESKLILYDQLLAEKTVEVEALDGSDAAED